ncbi:MAG: flagellar protein FlaG [Hyphomicrobiales bacterium]
MEIGRIPAIAPGATTNESVGNNARAVQTILPQYQTVPQTGRSESIPLTFREVPLANNANNNAAKEPVRTTEDTAAQQQGETLRDREIRKEIEVDRETSALIFRAIDITTGDVVRQYPEESRLNLSAYIDKILT